MWLGKQNSCEDKIPKPLAAVTSPHGYAADHGCFYKSPPARGQHTMASVDTRFLTFPRPPLYVLLLGVRPLCGSASVPNPGAQSVLGWTLTRDCMRKDRLDPGAGVAPGALAMAQKGPAPLGTEVLPSSQGSEPPWETQTCILHHRLSLSWWEGLGEGRWGRWVFRVLRAMAACPSPRGLSGPLEVASFGLCPSTSPTDTTNPLLPCTDFSQHLATCHPEWNRQAGRDSGLCRHRAGSAQSECQLTPLGVSPALWGPPPTMTTQNSRSEGRPWGRGRHPGLHD